jgi:hypothetical protein
MMEKGGAQEVLKVIAQTNADLLIAGGRNQYTALKARIPLPARQPGTPQSLLWLWWPAGNGEGAGRDDP